MSDERMSLRRVALVTGSASGLGVQTALALAEAGLDIVVNYREGAANAVKLLHRVEQCGVQSLMVQADVSQEADCQRLVQETLRRFGRLDVLVNNAGPYLFQHKPMTALTTDDWLQMLHGNLSSVFWLCREALPVMRRLGSGRIINFGYTGAGQSAGWAGRSAYAAAKSGLASLTRTLAQEEAEHGITVNMVCPGDIVGANKELTIQEVSQDGLRVGSGQDVARVVAFLCAEESDFVTGTVVEVNGGLQLHEIQT